MVTQSGHELAEGDGFASLVRIRVAPSPLQRGPTRRVVPWPDQDPQSTYDLYTQVLELPCSLFLLNCLATRVLDPIWCLPTSRNQRTFLLIPYPLLHCRPWASSFPNQYLSVHNFKLHNPFALTPLRMFALSCSKIDVNCLQHS